MPTQRAYSLAPWSASKVQTALRCAKLFHYRYVDKVKEPETMPETRIGKAVHSALEHALQGMALPLAVDEGAKLVEGPDEDDRYRRICQSIPTFLERIQKFQRARSVRRQWVEYTLAVDDRLQSTAFYAKNAFFRGIIDLAFHYQDTHFALVDHKSGLKHESASIAEQLQGYAVLAASSFSRLRTAYLGIHWVSDQEVEWATPIRRQEIERDFAPKVFANIDAAALAVADGPRAQTSEWCLRCSYRSICAEAQDLRFEPIDEADPGIEL